MLEIYLPQNPGKYKSRAQISRVVTERWAKENLFCPSCGSNLILYPPNTKVYDFYCSKCGEKFQLKSSSKAFTTSILGAAYKTTLQSLQQGRHPSNITML
ncbi:MAG: restriction endonuclease [Thaumarchaeota archaeon]|nr:restriction endonuclease [Nitrososphaerota archaeon]